MDWSLFASVAAMFSGIGACASAFATWRTVREMQKQREASYLPAIVCSLPVFTPQEQTPEVTIFNVGFGTARDARVDIDVPLNVLPPLNEALAGEHIRIRKEHDVLCVETSLPDGGVASYTMSIPCRAHIRFLFRGMDHGVKVRLPTHFQELIRIVTEKAFEKGDKTLLEILEKISLNISVTFLDIGGKWRHVAYQYSLFDATYDFERKTFRIRFN